MSTPVEQIKEKLSIVDVVGSYIKLTKAGSSYKALCPFHSEKSPSFNVSPSRQSFYCFGCNKGGDIFSFVEEIEGVEFFDALKVLAARAGVELRRDEKSEATRTERDRLLTLMEEVTKFYERNLLQNHEVKKYLVDRGLTEETVRSFRIGYAPNEWRLAYDHLHDKGYNDSEIEKAGLIKPTEGKSPYDRFRGRVMFPIFDQNGAPIAFSGRVFGEQKNQDGTDVAKYINSPEGLLYDKGAVMFGYDRARKAIREMNFTILVEGQMDLIMSHQAGTLNTVAVSGTALTERHLALLKRLSDNLVFAFDADDAGLAATARAFRLALAQGMNVRVAAIPNPPAEAGKPQQAAKDPADFIRDNPNDWSKVIADSTHIIDFYLTTLGKKNLDARAFREEVGEKVLPLLLEMQSKIEEAHFIIEIARKLGVKEDAVWEDVKRLELAERKVAPMRENRPEERKVFAALKSRRQVAEEEIIGILIWQEGHQEPAIDVVVHRTEYHERIGIHGLTPHEPPPEEKDKLALKAEYKYEHGPKLAQSVDELLDTIEEEVLKEKQAELWRKLSEAEARMAKDEAKIYLKQYQEITPQIIALEDRKIKRGDLTSVDNKKPR